MYSKVVPHDPTPADIAFLEFAQIFPVMSGWVALNGSFLNYRLPNQPSLHRNLVEAKRIISQQGLPLEVKGHSDYCTHILKISYRQNHSI